MAKWSVHPERYWKRKTSQGMQCKFYYLRSLHHPHYPGRYNRQSAIEHPNNAHSPPGARGSLVPVPPATLATTAVGSSTSTRRGGNSSSSRFAAPWPRASAYRWCAAWRGSCGLTRGCRCYDILQTLLLRQGRIWPSNGRGARVWRFEEGWSPHRRLPQQ